MQTIQFLKIISQLLLYHLNFYQLCNSALLGYDSTGGKWSVIYLHYIKVLLQYIWMKHLIVKYIRNTLLFNRAVSGFK